MNTINIVTEDNIKAVLSTIAKDMKSKVSDAELNSAIDAYFEGEASKSVDLQTAIVDIINNNIETIDINSVMPNLDSYATKTEFSELNNTVNSFKNNTYTKSEITRLINNASGGGSSSPATNVLYDPSGFDEYSSIDMMHNMLIGWNLGNQFECWNKVGNQIDDMNVVDRDLYYETLWGNPKVTKELINYVASVGIQAVRVPITWKDHIEPNGNAISLTWLARIKEVVDMIIENGMYCIINVHHDGSHKCKQIEFDPDYYLHSMSYFHNLWTQIGDYFKDYGYKLLFEGYNEVTNHTGNMTPNATKEAETVKYAQDFINTVRSQGSNNVNRFLVIPNYGGVSIMSADSFSLIHDTATDKLLLTTHAYPSGNTAGDNFYWIPQKLAKNPVGIIIDEIGTMPSDKFDLAFVKDVRTQASKKQVSTFWWDNGQREFNLIDRYWHVPSNAALGEYLGKDITIPTFSYDTLKSLTDMPYYAKFDLVDANHDYNKSRYMVICSQKPITDIVAVNNSRGYYGIKTDGGLYSVFVSDDARNYRVIETQLCSNTADLIIGTKHLLWGSTANSLFVESDYQIKNNPMGMQTEPDPEPEPEPQPTEPDEPTNPEPTNPVMGSATSPYVSTDKLNLNGFDKNYFDDVKDTNIYDNRVLFFKDDFDGDSLDSDIYSISNNEAEVNNGVCLFTNQPDTIWVEDSVVKMLSTPTPIEANGKTYPYRGSRFTMNLEFRDSLFEAKIRNTKAENWCTGIWTCGYSIKTLRSWPECGEIDFFEDTGGNDGLIKHVTLHYDAEYAHHSVAQNKEILNQEVFNAFSNSGNDGLWHIYGCEVTHEGIITLYFDHVPFMRMDTTTQPHANDFNPFMEGQHWIWDCCAWSTKATGQVSIDTDWIRVWSLDNKTPQDLIPQSVQLVDAGSKVNFVNGKVELGNFVQLKPVYNPPTVPMMMSLDPVKSVHESISLSDDKIAYKGGLGIKGVKEGDTSIAYTDLFGTSCTHNYTIYTRELPNGEQNLEDFDYNTEHYQYGFHSWYSDMNKSLPELKAEGKNITFGTYKVEPSTKYNIQYASRVSNSRINLFILDKNNNLVQKVQLTSTDPFETVDTAAKTVVEYGLADAPVAEELWHVHKIFVEGFKPLFVKGEADTSCTNIIVSDSMTIKTPTSIDYTLVPSNCTDAVVFKSNNTTVATVNDRGLVTPISDGTAIITLTCGEIVRTVNVTVNLTSSEEPVTTSFKLPSDIDTARYVDTSFSERFPYRVVVKDKVNNVYYAHFTSGRIFKSNYNTSKGCIVLRTNTGAMDWMTMRWNTSEFPNLVDYFEHYSDGRIEKTSTAPVSSGSYAYAENTDAGLKAVPTVDDIEVIYANYNIEGLYTSDFPCESVKATDMTITSPEPVKLSYKTTPVFVTDELKFTLSDASVIAIQEDGTIYPQSNGTTNVTIKCGNYTATCKVTVTLPEKDLTNKTVVRLNYSPNGEAFVDENIAWSKNTDTIFASFTGTNTSENQSVFSVGSNATNVGKWTSNTMHTIYPYKREDGKFAFSALFDGELRTTIPMSSDNKVKIAINKHNIYVNGTPILENGIWCDNKTGHTSSYNDLMKLTKLAIGSTEGTSRSFANYEEISIHHNLYTATEMKQLTTV